MHMYIYIFYLIAEGLCKLCNSKFQVIINATGSDKCNYATHGFINITFSVFFFIFVLYKRLGSGQFIHLSLFTCSFALPPSHIPVCHRFFYIHPSQWVSKPKRANKTTQVHTSTQRLLLTAHYSTLSHYYISSQCSSKYYSLRTQLLDNSFFSYLLQAALFPQINTHLLPILPHTSTTPHSAASLLSFYSQQLLCWL